MSNKKRIIIFVLFIILVSAFYNILQRKALTIKMTFDDQSSTLMINIQNLTNRSLYLPLKNELVYFTKILFVDNQNMYVQLGDNLLSSLVTLSEKSNRSLFLLMQIKNSLVFFNETGLNKTQLDSVLLIQLSDLSNSLPSKFHNYYLKPGSEIIEILPLQPFIDAVKEEYPDYKFRKINFSFDLNVFKELKSTQLSYPKKVLDYRLYKKSLNCERILVDL
jgi:hypothetical protein